MAPILRCLPSIRGIVEGKLAIRERFGTAGTVSFRWAGDTTESGPEHLGVLSPIARLQQLPLT